MSRSTSRSAGRSNTSLTHSRVASRSIGNVGYRAATARRSAAFWRCCHSGVRRSGRRRGRSRARAARLAEAAGEQRRPRQGRHDEVVDLVGIDGELLERELVDGLGQAQHDAVVAPEQLDLEPPALGQPGLQRHRPRRVHLGAERREHARPASRRSRRGSARRRWCGRRARRRWPRPARRGTAGGCGRRGRRGRGARGGGRGPSPAGAWRTSRTNWPTARPSSSGRPGPSPFQNGIFPGWPGAGRDDDPVEGDVLDAPGRRAEQERLARPRLVDHLLVELADAGAVGQEHAEEAPVGDRAGVGDGEALGARPAAEDAVDPVPHDAGPQLAELLGRVAAGEEVEAGVEGVVAQLGEVGAAADEGGEVVEGQPIVGRRRRGDHGDDLLAQHVEGVAGVAGALDQALVHALDDDGGLDEVGAVLREELAAARHADLVAGAADALEAGARPTGATRPARRGRRRPCRCPSSRLDVHTRPAQPAGLELVLDLEAPLPRQRAVVGLDELDVGRRRAGLLAAGLVQLGVVDLGGELVEAGGEPLGEAAGVDEHSVERCASTSSSRRGCTDGQIDRRTGPAGDGPADAAPRRTAPRLPMSSTGTTTSMSSGLAHAGVDDGDRPRARRPRSRRGSGRSPRAGAGWPTGRCAAAAGLPAPRDEVLEPLEGDRQVGAPLGGGQGVDLVDDDGLDAAQRLAGLADVSIR